jgi:two-component system, sensor histidine kinase and response regulator
MTDDQKKPSVLIVDDVPKNIQVLGSFLSRENLQIAFATNGEEALELATSNHFDLYLLDIMMPGMDGFQLCDRLKADKRTADVPIIFLTAKTDPESIILGFELGAQDYVTKPFNASELIARVRTQLELRKKTRALKELNKNLEEKVKQRTADLELANEQLSRLEKAKSEFLTIISHELRTPLNGIDGLAGLLNETFLDREQKDYLSHLTAASKRLSRFTEMALLITSLRSRNKKVDLFYISLEILIEMAIDEMEYTIRDKELTIHFEANESHHQILGDADLIRRCISLVIENGAQNMPSKSRIDFTIEEDANTTALVVRHNHIIFSPEMLEQFDAQVPEEKLIITENLNITLTAVKLIMHVHNGTMQLLNEDKQPCSLLKLVYNKQPV